MRVQIEKRCETCQHWHPSRFKSGRGDCAANLKGGRFLLVGRSFSCRKWLYYTDSRPALPIMPAFMERLNVVWWAIALGVLGNAAYDFIVWVFRTLALFTRLVKRSGSPLRPVYYAVAISHAYLFMQFIYSTH